MAIQTIQEQEEQEPNRARSYWRWSKRDFFPEPSFSNLTSYKASLSQTYPRLKDHLLDHSTDAFELVELRKASENSMRKCLTWWDLLWLSFGSVVGSGIFTSDLWKLDIQSFQGYKVWRNWSSKRPPNNRTKVGT